MKVFLILVTIVFFMPNFVLASEVILKSGQKVEGKVDVWDRSNTITVDTGTGALQNYSFNDVDTIDGKQPIMLQEKSKNNEIVQNLIITIIVVFVLFVLFKFCFS